MIVIENITTTTHTHTHLFISIVKHLEVTLSVQATQLSLTNRATRLEVSQGY